MKRGRITFHKRKCSLKGSGGAFDVHSCGYIFDLLVSVRGIRFGEHLPGSTYRTSIAIQLLIGEFGIVFLLMFGEGVGNSSLRVAVDVI